jgi:hypothetical protein
VIGEIEIERKKKPFYFSIGGWVTAPPVGVIPSPPHTQHLCVYIERIEKLFSSLMMINEFKPGGIERTSDHPLSLFHALLCIDY